ncbi:NgoFVII restriction endonuclease [Selenomonas sp. WCT3]|uniref:restriction endonuclease PLD domain-containing protein n=1 Tax=Selenomonas sp. WCT3 TaxID=3158785 RepID=UPI0008835689|nr:NgoFVII restriction endonuclease [Selenomonas ruminantium]
MLLSHDLEEPVLYDPARMTGLNCNHLAIVTGFTDCDMISQHFIQLHDERGKADGFSKEIKIDIILGMYKGAGITLRKHRNIMQTLNRINAIDKHMSIKCRYIYKNAEVHTKLYTWLKDEKPIAAYAGSANYSVNAFRIRREILTDCDPAESFAYYNSLLPDTIDCFDENVPSLLKLTNTSIPNDEISELNYENLTYEDLIKRPPIDILEVSWLGRDGSVGATSGPNWGIRPREGYIDKNGMYVKYNRDRNQAYIPYNKWQRKEGFFPDRKNPSDKNCPLFKAVTKDDGIFYMRMAQQGNKGIHTAESNAILGKWLRKKLRLEDGALVTLDDFKRYGRTSVKFLKYADDVFIMDF